MILIPKRKLPLTPDMEYWFDHTKESTITEIDTGYRADSRIGIFTWELKIPVGTDMYPGGH